MSYGKLPFEIFKIIEAGIANDPGKVRAYAELLAGKCEPETANMIKSRLDKGDGKLQGKIIALKGKKEREAN